MNVVVVGVVVFGMEVGGEVINAHTRERISREDRLIGRNIPKEHRLPPVQTWRAQNMFALLSNLQQFYLCHCTLT